MPLLTKTKTLVFSFTLLTCSALLTPVNAQEQLSNPAVSPIEHVRKPEPPEPTEGNLIREGWELRASLPRSTHKSGETIKLRLILKSTSDQPQTAPFILPVAYDFGFKVVTLDRKRVSLTKEFQDSIDTVIELGTVAPKGYKPGEEYLVELPISSIYDMTAPGTYSVTAWHGASSPNRQGLGVVVSNEVLVQVR